MFESFRTCDCRLSWCDKIYRLVVCIRSCDRQWYPVQQIVLSCNTTSTCMYCDEAYTCTCSINTEISRHCQGRQRNLATTIESQTSPSSYRGPRFRLPRTAVYGCPPTAECPGWPDIHKRLKLSITVCCLANNFRS